MKVFIVIIPWDYNSAKVMGVFKTLEAAKECVKEAMSNEEENAYNIIITKEIVE